MFHNGQRFASQAERGRYLTLLTLETVGEIADLKCQVWFPLVVNGVKVCSYVADFTYQDRTGTLVVEDHKGYRTPEYKLKAKLFAAVHGWAITETSARRTRRA